MSALLASSWAAPVTAILCGAALVAGATLGAVWDRATTAARHYYAPGRHRR
jgi:hypothetical protein